MTGRILLLLCCVGVSQGVIQASLSPLQPIGLRFTIEDESGVSLVAVHYSVNQELLGVAPGVYNTDINTKTGRKWVLENQQVRISPGDTVHYWVYRVRDGLGEHLLNQVWTVPGACLQTPNPATGTTPMRSPEEAPTTPTKPSTQCSTYPCVIFRDDFDSLDLATWQHEITAGGGGDWVFNFYTNNRSNSYVRDGVLFIKPTLTADKFGEAFLSSGTLDLWGSCTNNQFYGCERHGTPQHYINPIQSARLRTINSFSFRYGRVETVAKMPTGDWIWPAIWMLPTDNAYGDWPASGEIDLVESRGNRQLRNAQGKSIGVDTMGSTLHFGPFYPQNAYMKARVEKSAPTGTFGDSFHKYAVEWDENSIRFYLDNQLIKTIDPGAHGFWGLGEFHDVDNPWRGRGKMAPFDQKFHIILNVAVGGTGGFFPDSAQNAVYPKPWNDGSGTAMRDFWRAKNSWYPTWTPQVNNGEGAALQIKYIQVSKLKADP